MAVARVELEASSALLHGAGGGLMRLDTQAARIDPRLLASVRAELLAGGVGDGAFRFGYLLGVHPLSYLTFRASLVPHVGVETPAGSFLASFEAVA